MDRARQIAEEYRRALRAVDPEACAIIDSAAVAVGEGWAVEEIAIETADDVVTVARAAEIVGRSERWVYEWVHTHRDRIRSISPIMVRLGDVQEAVGRERARRAR